MWPPSSLCWLRGRQTGHPWAPHGGARAIAPQRPRPRATRRPRGPAGRPLGVGRPGKPFRITDADSGLDLPAGCGPQVVGAPGAARGRRRGALEAESESWPRHPGPSLPLAAGFPAFRFDGQGSLSGPAIAADRPRPANPRSAQGNRREIGPGATKAWRAVVWYPESLSRGFAPQMPPEPYCPILNLLN